MQVSALLLQQRPWPTLLGSARRWDASGARALYVADHLRGSPQFGSNTWLDAFTVLGALAATTSRIGLGTLVSSATVRDPASLALAARSVAEISGGRFELGIGAGGRKSDATLRGRPAPTPAESAAAFETMVATMDALEPRIPLHLAAGGPRTMRAAAPVADAWNADGARHGDRATQLTGLGDASARFDAALDHAGRDRAAVRRSVLVGIYPGMTYTSLDELFELASTLALMGFTELIVYDPPFALDGGPVAPPSVIDELLGSLDRFAAL